MDFLKTASASSTSRAKKSNGIQSPQKPNESSSDFEQYTAERIHTPILYASIPQIKERLNSSGLQSTGLKESLASTGKTNKNVLGLNEFVTFME